MSALDLLLQDERKDLLRFITAGSVDDGKSSLIGRLLYEAKGIYEDQLASVKKATGRRGAGAGEVDFSLFTDGLKAEREQNITIDVAYRYFSTPRRKFIIADVPGHEQYTRNMVTGASTAGLMVILIDASKGLLPQSRRHAFIASLLGIQHVVVAVNKMDLVDYSADVFERIRRDFAEFAAKLQAHDLAFIPVSALKGDNIVSRSKKMPWYQGTTLLSHLETVHIASDRNLIDLRFPVQYVSRPDATFRGYMGTVASGAIRPKDDILVLPSGATSRVRALLGPDGEIPEAFPPMSCCVVLEDEVDVSRGCMLVHPHNRPTQSDAFEAMVVWMASEPLQVGRVYQVKHTTRSTLGETTAIRYRIDVDTLHRREASSLEMNEVGRVVMKLGQPVAYDPYGLNRTTGAFILIDRVTNNTVGAGMILPRDPVEIAQTGQPAAQSAPQPAVAAAGGQRPRALTLPRHRPATIAICGFTNVSALAVATALRQRLTDADCQGYVLEDRSLRTSMPGQTPPSAALVARILNEAGVTVIYAVDDDGTLESLRREIPADQLLEVRLRDPSAGSAQRRLADIDVPSDDVRACTEQIIAILGQRRRAIS